jgi:hypothetical protein
MNSLLIQVLPAFTAILTPIFAPRMKLIARIMPKKKSIFRFIKKIKEAIIDRIATMNLVIPALLIKLVPKYETNIKVNIVEIPAPKNPPYIPSKKLSAAVEM